MLLPSLGHGLMFVVGVIAGLLGFLPMFHAVMRSRGTSSDPDVGAGLASVLVSFAFLWAFELVVWLLVEDELIAASVGMLVGFLAMWGVLAVLSTRNRS